MDLESATATLADTKADPQLRFEAALLLGRSGDSEIIGHLRHALCDSEWKVRWGAALALGEARASEAVPDLIRLLRDADDTVRQAAEGGLAQLARSGGSEVIRHLRRALGNSEGKVRWSTALALGEARASEAVPDLIRLLGDADDTVRQAAERSLAQIARSGSGEVIGHLRRALGNSEGEVRLGAALALGEARASEAVPDLVRLLGDADERVRQVTETTLEKISVSEPEIVHILVTDRRRHLNPIARLLDRLFRISEARARMLIPQYLVRAKVAQEEARRKLEQEITTQEAIAWTERVFSIAKPQLIRNIEWAVSYQSTVASPPISILGIIHEGYSPFDIRDFCIKLMNRHSLRISSGAAVYFQATNIIKMPHDVRFIVPYHYTKCTSYFCLKHPKLKASPQYIETRAKGGKRCCMYFLLQDRKVAP